MITFKLFGAFCDLAVIFTLKSVSEFWIYLHFFKMERSGFQRFTSDEMHFWVMKLPKSAIEYSPY